MSLLLQELVVLLLPFALVLPYFNALSRVLRLLLNQLNHNSAVTSHAPFDCLVDFLFGAHIDVELVCFPCNTLLVEFVYLVCIFELLFSLELLVLLLKLFDVLLLLSLRTLQCYWVTVRSSIHWQQSWSS